MPREGVAHDLRPRRLHPLEHARGRRAQLPAHGWGLDQFGCLNSLWMGESGWRYTAENSSSGAYGIPQSLPGSKMGTVASDWRTNPVTQIRWGLKYIKSSYGTPCGAWGAWQSRSPHWY